MSKPTLSTRVRAHVRSNVWGIAAMFVALSGTAYATHPGGANTISTVDIVNGEVKTADIGTDEVKTADIGTGEVRTGDIGASAVTTGKVANDTLIGADIADTDSIGSAEIGGLTGADIADSSITPDEISAIPAVRAIEPVADVPGIGCVGGQVVPGDGTLTPMGFKNEYFDTANMHEVDPGCTDPDRSRVTAPRTGIYMITAAVVWDNQPGGTRFLGLRANGDDLLFYAASRVPGFADIPEQSVSTIQLLGAGEYIEAMISQNSGNPVSIDCCFRRQHLAMSWVGPSF